MFLDSLLLLIVVVLLVLIMLMHLHESTDHSLMTLEKLIFWWIDMLLNLMILIHDTVVIISYVRIADIRHVIELFPYYLVTIAKHLLLISWWYVVAIFGWEEGRTSVKDSL